MSHSSSHSAVGNPIDSTAGREFGRRWIACVAAQDPDRYQRFERMIEARRAVRLPRRLQELIYIAVDFQAAHLYADGGEVHIVGALSEGASVAEVIDALEISASLTYRSLGPALTTAAAVYGEQALPQRDEASPSDDRVDALLARMWPELLDVAAHLLPDVFPGLVDYVSAPQRPKALSEQWRALIALAVYASPVMSDDQAVTRAARWCRDLDIPVEQVAEAIFSSSLIGTHAYTRGYPAIVAALNPDRDRYSLGIPG